MIKLMLVLLTSASLIASEVSKEISKAEKVEFIATYFLKTMDSSTDLITRSIPEHAKNKVNDILSGYYKDMSKKYSELISKYLNDKDIDMVYNFYKSEASDKLLKLTPEFSQECMTNAAKMQSDIMMAVMQKPEEKSTKSICTEDSCEVKTN